MTVLLDTFAARFDPDRLRRMALRLARAFPASLIERADFLQIGRVGILGISRGQEESLAQFVSRGYTAAWRDMIDAARQAGRIRNRQVYGYDLEAKLLRVSPIDLLNDQLDLERFLRGVSLRDRSLLRMFAHGATLKEVGILLHISEGRVSQIRSALGRQYRIACL